MHFALHTIGAGVIKLSGNMPPFCDSEGKEAQHTLWGICKTIKKINVKNSYSATEGFRVSSPRKGHCALLSSNGVVDYIFLFTGPYNS